MITVKRKLSGLLFILLFLSGFCLTKSESAVFINEILAANASTNIDSYFNDFSDWIELYNSGEEPVDLAGYFLTDDLTDPFKWEIRPDTIISAGGFKIFWADGEDVYNHMNFQLKMEGEEISLVSPEGMLIDSFAYDVQLPDVSFGRQPDGNPDRFYFGEPTPNASNSTQGVFPPVIADSPDFSLTGGFYTGSQVIGLLATSPTAVIRYTLDGSKPTNASVTYTVPINIDSTTVIRARIFDAGYLPSPVITHTYFIDETVTLPVVSIVTDPDNLWNNEIGIYAWGDDYDPEPPYYGANFWHDWERPISLEFYETNGSLGFSLNAGVEIYGGATVAAPEKSLAIYAKDKYGTDEINYKIFDDKSINTFKRFVLRNSGNDWALTMFRDGMMQTLLIGQMDIDYQAYRPVIVFLNGEYWGIYNIREKMDEYYPESNYGGVSHNNIDLLQQGSSLHVIEGDAVHYDALLDFIDINNMALPANYEYIKTQMDMDEYLNYQISEIYFVNEDWPGGNMKFWRPKTVDGKWRWMLYDTDFGFDLGLGYGEYDYNMLVHATATDGPSWPNPSYSTFLFRNLLYNPDFRNDFIQRFAAYLNITFEPNRVIGIINSLKSNIESEIPRHSDMWGEEFDGWMGFISFSDEAEWATNIDVMRTFANERPAYVRQHIIDYFGLIGTVEFTLNVSPAGSGKILTNTVVIPGASFTGPYFKIVPIQLKAVPNTGYRFVEWQGIASGSSEEISLFLLGDSTITAVFEEGEPINIVINELHYNPSPSQGDDDLYEFVELYNAGESTVDLSGYSFTDGIEFTFPDSSSIAPDEYIVVAKTAATYSGQGYQVFQWTGGKLANEGELVQLSNNYGHEIDYVAYGIVSPWPTEPDGNGPSLSLINPSFDNALPESWGASHRFGGTPGERNFQGDINNDGVIDISDVILCLRMAVGLSVTIQEQTYNSPYPDWLINLANINGDEQVDISDVILILRISVGLD